DGIRDLTVTGVQTCALPISLLSEVVRTGVARDPEKPGVEPAGHVVGVAILQDSHEHLLHQILGQRRVAGGPAEEVEHRTMVALRSEERRVGKEGRSRGSPYG